MKKLAKISLFVLIITSIGFFNIGGCGGGGGGGGNNGGGGVVLGPCPMPALNSNFGKFNYFFIDIIDQDNIGEIAVISDGVEVMIELTAPGLDDSFLFFADVLGPNDCSINEVTVVSGGPVLGASGTCERVAGGLQFALTGVTIGDLEIPSLLGDCVGPEN